MSTDSPAYRLGKHCGFSRADLLSLSSWSVGRENEDFEATWNEYLRGFEAGEARALRSNLGNASLPQPRDYGTLRAVAQSRENFPESDYERAPAHARTPKTFWLRVSLHSDPLETQVADAIENAYGRIYYPEILEISLTRGTVYAGSQYLGQIRTTAMSDTFRFIADRSFAGNSRDPYERFC